MARPVGHPDGPLIAKYGNEIRWAAVDDRTAATQKARDTFNERFVAEARERFGNDLAPDDLARRAEHLRKAHYLRLALKSAQARRKRSGRTPGGGGLDAERPAGRGARADRAGRSERT
jgi:hypothetical protein